MRKIIKNKFAYALVLPAVILSLVFIIWPLLSSIVMSFYKWDGILKPEFVGLRNYVKLFTDESFLQTVFNNLWFCFLVVIGTVFMGFLFAAAIHMRVKGWKIFKFVYYIPVMLSLTVVGSLFVKILDPNFGPFNLILEKIGLGNLAMAWLGDFRTALYTLVIVTIWQYSGFTMILLLTSMENISKEIHDAASIDGVNGVQRLFWIIFPCIKRTFFVVVMTQMIFSFKTFDLIYVMTNGGPGGSTEILGTLMYRYAFKATEYGYGSAVSVVMVLIISVISMIYLKMSNIGENIVE